MHRLVWASPTTAPPYTQGQILRSDRCPDAQGSIGRGDSGDALREDIMGSFFVLGDRVGGGESLQGGFRGEGTEQGVEFVRRILTDGGGRRRIRGE